MTRSVSNPTNCIPLLPPHKPGYATYEGIGSRICGAITTGGTTYYAHDAFSHNGSVIKQTNAAGTVIRHTEYNAFGQVLGQSTSGPDIPNRFGYQSNWITLKDSDGRFGLSPTRTYDAELGLFAQRDPLGVSLGRYAYVSNHPTIGVDAAGLQEGTTQYEQSAVVEMIDLLEEVERKAKTKGVSSIQPSDKAIGHALKRSITERERKAYERDIVSLSGEPIIPTDPDTGKTVETTEFNCAGLAFRTFDWKFNSRPKSLEELKRRNCKRLGACDDACAEDEWKVWLWTYQQTLYINRRPRKSPHRPWDEKRPQGVKFHIVSHPCVCDTCFSKWGKMEISGPVDPRSERRRTRGPILWKKKTGDYFVTTKWKLQTEECFKCPEKHFLAPAKEQ